MKFVSFEDAIKASVEGNVVSSWLNSETIPYNIHHPKSEVLSKEFKINKFLLLGSELTRFNELKWTID